MNRIFVPSFLFLLVLIFPSLALEESAIDNEITNLRRELASVQSERQRNRDDAAKDRKDFAAYTERTKKRLDQAHMEADTIRQQIKMQEIKSDSLAASVNAARARKKEYDLLQDNLRQRCIDACERLLATTQNMPPLAAKNPASALMYLRGEVQNKSVDNIETIQRFAKIIADLRDATFAIQVFQGTSPVTDLKGTIEGIRIGTIFEAYTDEKLQKVALWKGYDQRGNARYEIVDNPDFAAAIDKAYKVRDGKNIPQLIGLPLVTNISAAPNPAVTGGAR